MSIIGGKKGRGMGREEWERAYYPDVVRRIRAGRSTPAMGLDLAEAALAAEAVSPARDRSSAPA